MKELLFLFDNQAILQRGDLRYVDLPFFNHSTPTSPQHVKEAVNAITSIINWHQLLPINAIVGEEEYGGFLTACVAMQQNIPFSLAKENSIHAINGIGIEFPMAYNANMTLYLNGIKKGDRVVIIDDIISTGGTMIALIQALEASQVTILDIVALVEKVDKKGAQTIKEETGYDVKTVIRLDCSKERTRLMNTIFDA